MSNPRGINQYSGGGKGGKKVTIMDSRTGLHHQITRDLTAQRIKSARKALKSTTGKKASAVLRADISNLHRAAKRSK